MNKSLQQINLRRYLPFFVSSPDKNHALAIYNNYGTQQFLECCGSKTPIIKLLQVISNQNYDWNSINTETFHQLDKNNYLQITPLKFGVKKKQFWLIGVLKEKGITPEQQTSANNNLTHIAQCLQEDFLLTESLTGMTNELMVRSEELNLLYGIDDSDSYYKGLDQQQSLTYLLNNCITLLNIDLAIIYLPELDICLHQAGSQVSIDPILLTNLVNQQIYPYLTIHQEILVNNNNEHNKWTDAGLNIPYNFVIFPIVKSNQRLNGILVLTNEIDKPDFSNSDRKLGEILAAEASKITQARRDSITGQFNRRGITEELDKVISLIDTHSGQYCLLLINIDQFKVINDTAGQAGGDQLLKQVNSLIQKNLKNTDELGRLGADEFAVILNNCNIDDAVILADKIRLVIKQFRYFYKDKLFDISTCVGVVELNNTIDDFSEALRSADLACSVAKEAGGNRTHVFEIDDKKLVSHESQMQWLSRINIGLVENRFQIYRQKIHPLQKEESLEHYEILLRLEDNYGNTISPFHFIPAAERYNLMTKLDQWVVKTTLKKLALFEKKMAKNTFSCSINLSGQSFCEEGFSAFLIEQIEKSGVPPANLCFEITETAAVSNLTQTIEFMEKIKAIGCQFSLDDFGSGMSSFTYLKNLPVDYLKIDGYFIKTLLENEIDKAMVKAIHQIGSVMGLKTIAEFVENDAILEELRSIGIDYGQGYSIGKPEPF